MKRIRHHRVGTNARERSRRLRFSSNFLQCQTAGPNAFEPKFSPRRTINVLCGGAAGYMPTNFRRQHLISRKTKKCQKNIPTLIFAAKTVVTNRTNRPVNYQAFPKEPHI